jgi:SAM-dependent methyltransferase
MDIAAEIRSYYDRGEEDGRLTAEPSLELIRTQVLLARHLPVPPSRVLDVGGGSGVHAHWLSSRGHQVDLVDPVPLHVEQARSRGVAAEVGDARDLEANDDAYDAVLLLGPLYHLTDPAERIRALTEAARVVRPGGVVIAAGISRYASLFEGFFHSLIDDAGFTAMMRADLRTGRHRNPENHPGRFTTSYFHSPTELSAEIEAAGLIFEAVLPVEGMLGWAPGIADRLADKTQREMILDLLSEIESDPALLAATSHLLAVARRPSAQNSRP